MVQLSQVIVHKNGKAFFTGVGDSRLPGAIQIWRMIDNSHFMEKVNEV